MILTLSNRYTKNALNHLQSHPQVQHYAYATKRVHRLGYKMTKVKEATDCVKCGNYTTVMEQVQAVKTGKMLCEYCR